MSDRVSRRALLRAAGAATLCGLAGCGSGGGTTTTLGGTTTYDVAVTNEWTAADYEQVPELSGPEPFELTVTVEPFQPGSDPVFERTVDLGPGDTRTFEEAFTVTAGGDSYAMETRMAQVVDGGLGGYRDDEATFTPDDRPQVNPVGVGVTVLELEDGVAPAVSIDLGRNLETDELPYESDLGPPR